MIFEKYKETSIKIKSMDDLHKKVLYLFYADKRKISFFALSNIWNK